jgi:hypothetical protein
MPALEAALSRLAGSGALRASDLADLLTRDDDPDGVHFRTLAWLAKLGIVHLGD